MRCVDEPAAGLDPKARYELRVILKQLAEQGMTVFLSSHILSELQDMCDGAVIIKDGYVVAAGLMDVLQGQLEGMDGAAAPVAADVAVSMSAGIATVPVAQLPHVAVLLKTLGDAESLRVALAGLDICDGAEIAGPHEVRARLQGDDTAIPTAAFRLLSNGIPIVGIQKLEMGLEEMFMKFTR